MNRTMKINNFENFINEMAAYNEIMSIADLIYILEQKEKDAFIVAIDQERYNKDSESEHRFLINEIVEIPSEGMVMSNIGFTVEFSGKKHKFYTYKVEEDKMLGITARFEILEEDADKINLPTHKTVGQLINELKKIPNPEKALFLIRGHRELYDPSDLTYENSFEAPRALGNYNMSTYPLCKDGELVSGNIETAYMFMSEGSEGRYHYKKK